MTLEWRLETLKINYWYDLWLSKKLDNLLKIYNLITSQVRSLGVNDECTNIRVVLYYPIPDTQVSVWREKQQGGGGGGGRRCACFPNGDPLHGAPMGQARPQAWTHCGGGCTIYCKLATLLKNTFAFNFISRSSEIISTLLRCNSVFIFITTYTGFRI